MTQVHDVTHVMVPVPQEHVEAVQEYLRWQAGPRPISVPHAEAITAACQDLDDASWDLLDIVHRALVDKDFLSTGEVAEQLGVSHREVMGTIVEINERARLAGGPPIMLLRDATEERRHLGERIINMTRETGEVLEQVTRPS